MDLKVIDNKGKAGKSVKFDEKLLGEKSNGALLHEVIVAFNSNQRSGTHSAKTRSEVSGGGIKPWRQKGTGRARAGSIRSPLWRHGGMIFAVKPRNYRQELTKKKRKAAFKMAVMELLNDGRLQVVEPIGLKEPKTKNVATVLSKWKAPTDSLLVVDTIDPNLSRASRNISNIELVEVDSLNLYHCLRARKIFITPMALEKLATRVARPARG